MQSAQPMTRRHLLLATATTAMTSALFATRRVVAAAAADDVAGLEAAGGKATRVDGVVTKLEFRDCKKLGPAEYEQIGRLKDLTSLTLYGGGGTLNDKTLPSLAGLQKLQTLSTEGAQLSDDGMKSLASLSSLQTASFFHISLKMEGFTGAGFAHLKPLAKLERLTVAGTPFNDKGMAAVGQLTQLREFRTWHTYQTSAGTPELTKLTKLRSLRFGQRLRQWNGKPNPLTLDDAAVEVLAKIASLESLTLDEANLSLEALRKLKALPKLKDLTLEKIIIGEAEVKQLQAELPTVKIKWTPMTPADLEKVEKALKV